MASLFCHGASLEPRMSSPSVRPSVCLSGPSITQERLDRFQFCLRISLWSLYKEFKFVFSWPGSDLVLGSHLEVNDFHNRQSKKRPLQKLFASSRTLTFGKGTFAPITSFRVKNRIRFFSSSSTGWHRGWQKMYRESHLKPPMTKIRKNRLLAEISQSLFEIYHTNDNLTVHLNL